MNGVLIVDKPAGPTSHDIVAHVRRVAGIKKVGHGGTLDPFATGVLLILVGRTTRLMEYINMLPKTYAAELTLGAVSDTGDPTGKITCAGKTLGVDGETPRVEEAHLKNCLASFLGPQKQTPPAYSAIKIKGQKAYRAARQGIPLQLKPRDINIYDIQFVDYKYPTLSLTVTCSSGTYIRALARDIGLQLKTGAYLSKLCRTSIGINPTKPNKNMEQKSQKFTLKNAVKLSRLTASNLTSHLLPSSTLVAHLPSIILPESSVAQLKNGQKIEWGSTLPPEQSIAMFTKNNQLLGIGRFDPVTNHLLPRKIL